MISAVSSVVEQGPYKAKVGSSTLSLRTNIGELAEWLRQQFAKLSLRNRRIGSNPILSAIFLKGKLIESKCKF